MSPLIIIVAILFVVWLLQSEWKKYRVLRKLQHIHGPLHLPIIGSGLTFLSWNAKGFAEAIHNAFNNYPDIMKLWVFNDLYFFVTQPEYLKIIFSKNSNNNDKIILMDKMKDLGGHGLFTVPGKNWKKSRKMISPSFNKQILREFPEIISKHCKQLTELLMKESGKEIDCSNSVTDTVIDIALETLCGFTLDADFDKQNFASDIVEVMEQMFTKMVSPYYYCNFIYKMTSYCKKDAQMTNNINRVSAEIFRKKKEEMKNKTATKRKTNLKPFLELLLENHLKNEITQNEVEKQINTFLLASVDTTASELLFILTVLGMYPDIQEKVYAEIIETYGLEGSPTYEDASKLDYTTRVIKESLRLFPPAALTGRNIEEEIVLPNFTIPVNSQVAVSILHVHRSEKNWDEPLKFDPDRFLPEEVAKRDPYVWIPFGLGPRDCIGYKTAMIFMQILIIWIVRKFKVCTKLKSIEEIELCTTIVTKPKNPLLLSFYPR